MGSYLGFWLKKRKHFGNSVQQLNLELGANGEELFSDPAVHALFKYKHFPCNITGPFDGEQIQIKVFWLHHQSGAKWLKRNVSLLQNRVNPHGSLRGQLKMRWLQRKGGKCRCSISMKSFLFLILLTVFQFSIKMRSLSILHFNFFYSQIQWSSFNSLFRWSLFWFYASIFNKEERNKNEVWK